jgi:hypothetical protein
MTSSDPRLIALSGKPQWLIEGRLLPYVSGGDGDTPADAEVETFEIPEDLTTLADGDLDEGNPESLTARAVAAFNELAQNENPGSAEVDAVAELADAIEALRAERGTRAAAADERRESVRSQMARVNGPEDEPDDDGGGETGDEGDEPVVPVEVVEDTPELESVAASANRRGIVVSTPLRQPTLNPTLAQIAARAPDPGIEDPRPEVVITAAADVPRLSPGQRIPTVTDLVNACTDRAKALGVSNGNPVFVPLATINRTFPTILDSTMSEDAVMAAFEAMVDPHRHSQQAMEALVAAGGWCAPSEIRYEFFQISEVAGLWDAPTFGVQRGGIRFPINGGLSLFDFFALSGAPASGIPTAGTMPWEWTEADDIATVTGTGAKLCLRPPCPSFDEVRLRAFGICVTAGNLTEDAYPELIRHFIAQTVIAHARVINRRHLLLAAAASTATTPVGTTTESPTTHILGGYGLNAADYREKHGMAPTAVLEGVMPSWTRELMRSDLAKRNGFGGAEGLNVGDQMLSDFFDTRYIRMQWVQDWQTRGAAAAGSIAPTDGSIPTNWPTSVQGMLYAPGTFGRGNGMRLDLGVVRDSVLNAENDHTAAWSEEATLIAKFGHESRLITFDDLVANGASGSQQTPTGP